MKLASGMRPLSSANMVKRTRMRKPLVASASKPRFSMRRATVASRSAMSRVTRAARSVGSRLSGSVQIARRRSWTSYPVRY